MDTDTLALSALSGRDTVFDIVVRPGLVRSEINDYTFPRGVQ